jgi:hypothetical protein
MKLKEFFHKIKSEKISVKMTHYSFSRCVQNQFSASCHLLLQNDIFISKVSYCIVTIIIGSLDGYPTLLLLRCNRLRIPVHCFAQDTRKNIWIWIVVRTYFGFVSTAVERSIKTGLSTSTLDTNWKSIFQVENTK